MSIPYRAFQFSYQGSRRSPPLPTACFCLLFTGGAQQNFVNWRYLLSTAATDTGFPRHENPLATLARLRAIAAVRPASAPGFRPLFCRPAPRRGPCLGAAPTC